MSTEDNGNEDKTTFIVLTERNDWEGETWHFYIAYDSGTMNMLKKLSERCNTVFGEEAYTVRTTTMTEEQIKELPSNDGYMRSHNIIKEFNKIKLEAELARDVLYKGGLFNFTKSNDQ